LIDRIDAWARHHGLERSEAIRAFCEQGLTGKNRYLIS
jgi:hypothetical protein